ncbi:VTT domain-containing protein [Candidatus Woesearchaeota archaeon]|nr:VTT domain-containing protein [Candidatus Woesearchaeota archaeon]
MPDMDEFSKDSIFAYNINKKRLSGLLTILISALVLIMFLYYFLILKHSDHIIIKIINTFFTHIFTQIGNSTILGAFYTALFGGLFFIFVPIEAVFVSFATKNNPLIVIALFIIGFMISYTVNYYIGMKLVNFSKNIIGPRKFYKIKVKLNKWGGWAIFMFNALPLPSQPLATILGIFKYNKTRFYTIFILGQLVKYFVIVTLIMGFT